MILCGKKNNTNCLKLSLFINKLSLMLTVILLLISTNVLGEEDYLILDSCDYASKEDANKSWKGTYPVKIEDNIEKNKTLVLPFRFFKPGGLCHWDKTFSKEVNLSDYKYISFDLHYSGKPIGYRAIYFGFADEKNPKKIAGWYAYMLRSSLKKGWNRFLLKRENFKYKGGKYKDGWLRIKKLRLSFWGTKKGSQTMLLDNIYASNVPVASSFDLLKVKGELYNNYKLTVLPEPQQMKQTGLPFQIISGAASAYISNDEASQRVFSLATNEFKNNYGIKLQKNIIPPSSNKVLILGDINKAQQQLLKQKNIKLKNEGYYLEVCNEYVLLLAQQEKGLYYGIQTLLQLTKPDNQKISIPGVEITDFPSLKMRAIYLHKIGNIEKTKKVIKALSAIKFNYVFIDLSSTIKYNNVSFSRSVRKAFSRKQMLELAEFARKHYISICPYYQFFSHVNWIAAEPKYRSLLENPKQLNWMSSWCPSNQGTYRLAFSMLDDAIDIFKPEYIHIAHDEIEFTTLGSCPKCKTSDRETLVANSVNKLVDYLKSKNVKTVVWSDFLENRFLGKSKFTLNAKKLSKLLKPGMIMDAWDYGHDLQKIKTRIKILKDRKDTFIISPSNDDLGIKMTSEEMLDAGGLGAMMTLWHKWGIFSSFPNKICSDALGLIGLSANYFWNPKADMVRFQQYDWSFRMRRVFQPNWNVPLPNQEISYKSINLEPYINCKFIDKKQIKKIFCADSIPWTRTIKIDKQSINLNDGFVILRGHQKDTKYPSSISIPINQQVKNITFVQCLRKPSSRKYWEKLDKSNKQPQVGAYKISYDDGSSKLIRLKFRWNIETWNSRTGIYDGKIIWQDKNKDDYLVRLWAMPWENPFPNKKVAKIEFTTNNVSSMNPMLFALIVGN